MYRYLSCFKQRGVVQIFFLFVQENVIKMSVGTLVVVILGSFFVGLLTGPIVIGTILWYVCNLQGYVYYCIIIIMCSSA